MKRLGVIVGSLMILIIILMNVLNVNDTNCDKDENCKVTVQKESNKDATIDNEDEFDHTRFMSKILSNDQSVVKTMIKRKDFDSNYIFDDGKVYFENVLVFMNVEMAKILLDAGTDPHLVTSSGETIVDIINKSDNKKMKELIKSYIDSTN
jgi:ankyrin repeat protein